MSTQANTFEAMERDFKKVFEQLSADDSLKTFRNEYEKLHSALKKSHENEKMLINKCRSLNAEILQNASKVHAALRLSQEDQNSIQLLKKEIDKAWKMVDAAHEKEKNAKKTTAQLKVEIANLSRLVDQGAGLSIGQENAVNDLLAEKEKFQAEVTALNDQIKSQSVQIDSLKKEVDDFHNVKTGLTGTLETVQENLRKALNEAERESRRAQRLQDEMIGIKEQNDKRELEIQQLAFELDRSKGESDQLRLLIKDNTINLERFRRAGDDLRLKNDEYERRIEGYIKQQQRTTEEMDGMADDSKSKSELIRKKSEEIEQLRKKLAKGAKDFDQLMEKKTEGDTQRDMLKSELLNLSKEMDTFRRHADADEKLIKELQVSFKRLNVGFQQSKEKNKASVEISKAFKETKRNLEQDIKAHKLVEEKLRKQNSLLEMSQEKASIATLTWQQKFEQAQEMIKEKEMENTELQKKINEEKAKLKTQQAMYEAVRADRNQFSQQSIELQDEVSEMKRKFKIMTHQIDQLKEEIRQKEQAVIQQHFQVKGLKEEMKTQKKTEAKKDALMESSDQLLASQDIEIKNLRFALMEAEQAQRQQKKVYDDVVAERDVLGSQLIRRNDELALLYEKVKIQESILAKGEIQYHERLNDIKLMKRDLADMERQLALKSNQLANTEALKSELHHLQIEILSERTKVAALSEELETPMNVHRWRKLEGSDPKAFEMLQKIQTLQRRLIVKTEQVVEKDLMIEESQKLYMELKNILARQPGPEIAEQLCAYQQSLKNKTKQMKALAAELNMLQAQTNEYRYEIDRITGELQDVKRKYLEQKKFLQLDKEAQRGEHLEPNEPLLRQQHQFIQQQNRFVGGGFNLNA
ncbi:Cilia- and flagella-associated protein 58 central coiled coil domain-containing protein [Plasmodiophora brassicae]|uniref:Cilia- and flagella-associated protein 58 central coiled coil domain-containing protein n=1 Tax=Plasmodiophora brassicae TaxID=37360 RepID=A0A0G4IVH0_PLABS|nr:hypothetical protein PBRA_001133 [Plasmodiophora brassicae]SPQ97237.1 unnamed protein product [Plasmodiophora brassicae]